MRIIAGIARGMTLAVPRGDKTRPTSDRTREAIFSSLGDRVANAVVLDLFAGTGGLGLEAASRGARSVTFVEQNRGALECLRRNVESAKKYLSVELEVLPEEVFRCLRRWHRQFDLVFADPPYGEYPQQLLQQAALPGVLTENGLFVLELAKRDRLEIPPWQVVRDAIYGDTRVVFLRLPASAEPK
jgi:16S rRNA (guanine966-N2)-methyltransferase